MTLIADASWRYPDDDHWIAWKPGAGIEPIARELSRQLATTPEAVALLDRSIVAVNASSLGKGGCVSNTALWVPDPATGEPRGILEVSIHTFSEPSDASAGAFVARNWRKDYGGWRVKITERSAEIIQCPAGPAVIETIVGRRRGERPVQGYSSYFVFPADGTPEAMCLTFNTIHLDLLVELTVLGRTIADSLQITTGPATS